MSAYWGWLTPSKDDGAYEDNKGGKSREKTDFRLVTSNIVSPIYPLVHIWDIEPTISAVRTSDPATITLCSGPHLECRFRQVLRSSRSKREVTADLR
jgi:hypothetical protein